MLKEMHGSRSKISSKKFRQAALRGVKRVTLYA
jgi:hypothetical protein